MVMKATALRQGIMEGETASAGIARGRAVLCSCARRIRVPRHRLTSEASAAEIYRFDEAVAAIEGTLERLRERVAGDIDDGDSEILTVQTLMLKDPSLRDRIDRYCRKDNVNVEVALDEVIREQAAAFEALEDPVFREKAADLQDIGKRLTEYLLRDTGEDIDEFPEESVLVAPELLPSIIAQLGSSAVRGIVVENGGRSAHASIIARALGIPLLVKVPGASERIRSGDRLIVDGDSGKVYINPDTSIDTAYAQEASRRRKRRAVLQEPAHLPAVTRDGVEVRLGVNLGLPVEIESALEVRADEVGLFRTELAFFDRSHFPTEDEQFELYRTVAKRLAPRRVVIRAFDIGSDKALPSLELPVEPNPALGVRGTRLLLSRPGILRAQLKAIFRVAAEYPVEILFPMIDGVEMLLEAKRAIAEAAADLRREGGTFASGIPVGVMVETPASVLLAEPLAREVDFFNIGTNDLIQYLLAADRTGSGPAYNPGHPAVFEALATVVRAAGRHNRPVRLCGEMATDPEHLPRLLALGFRNFSVAPSAVPRVKEAVRSVDIGTVHPEFVTGRTRVSEI